MTTAFSPFGSQVVEHSPEITRIAALPRRVWSEDASIKLAEALTRELRRPGGTMHLRPVQAIALYEAMELGGMFGPQRVGAGKSLLFLLLPLVLEAKRPVLFTQANLVEKTWNDPTAGYKVLSEHWYLPKNIQIISCEMMGLVQSANKLDYIKPDFMGLDECHVWKNRRAGRTRRLVRYMREYPETRVAAASGTIMKGSIEDFAHVLRWCLKTGAPVPNTDEETSKWAEALDEKVNPLSRRKPGALFDLGPTPSDGSEITRARQVFQARLLETPGVVASARNDGVTCSLQVTMQEYQPAAVTVQHIANMKGLNDTPEMTAAGKGLAWITPDGWTFSEAIELRRYIRELALGFHGVWDPRPLDEWRNARRDWAVFVRETLSVSRTLDTELQVANATDAGTLPDSRQTMGTHVLATWRYERDKPREGGRPFKINAKPVWHDDTALHACVKWMEKERGIVWCEHVFFAKRLAQLSGCTYYGADGLSEAGESITLVQSGRAIIASVQANSTGRNLQMFDSNLITSFPPSAHIVEQLLGRTHRDGQEADTVRAFVLMGCREHHEALMRAIDGAKAALDTLGHEQKILLADVVPLNLANRTGPLWV